MVAVTHRTDKPYSKLGKLLDLLARRRSVRGPYAIAQRVSDTGHKVSGQAVSKHLYGESRPRPPFLSAFAEAFALTPEERGELAWTYTYGRDAAPTAPRHLPFE